MELNIFHLNNKQKLLEDENEMTDEVGSIGQHAGKLSVQELQGIASQGEDEVLVLPSVPTAGQLLNSPSISENQVTNGKSNCNAPKIPQNFYNKKIIIYSGYNLANLGIFLEIFFLLIR